ncbi:antirestriction protein ArdA [Lactobacillus taiwanensis]|uniref:antirestriction protein ArdA n=1 Tax=Lactobacillus taiwanensis TaxID=508451 RepID=UPI0026149F34
MEINVFVSSLGAYNEGVLTGQWTTLPVDNVQKEILDKIDGSVGDEFFITDYEAPFKIYEFADIRAVNNLARALENFEDLEEVYWTLDGRENLSIPEVYEFDEEFFETMFSSPAEAVRATFFGNIQNWMDKYIYFNGYMNLESMNDFQFESEIKNAANEIIEQFCGENELAQVN